MPGNSLGYVGGGPPRSFAPPVYSLEATTETLGTSIVSTRSCGCAVPKGFLPLLFYSLFFLSLPIEFYYMNLDFVDLMTRTGFFLTAFATATFLLVANDPVVVFNMVLFFHIGVEAKVLDDVTEFALNSPAEDYEVVLAWLTFGIIIVHLLPFLLLDNPMLLIVLAYVGILVNTAALSYLAMETGYVFAVGLSATTLLGVTLLIASNSHVKTSMLTQLRNALSSGSWLLCMPFKI